MIAGENSAFPLGFGLARKARSSFQQIPPLVSMTINLDFAPRSPFSARSRFLCCLAAVQAAALLLSFTAQAQVAPAQQNQPATATGASPATASAVTGAPAAPITGVSAPAGYVLSPNDLVAVEVFGEDDLRTNGRLNPEGNLSIPLLGPVQLAGLTLTQAAARLTELYGKDYLVNPKVNVILAGFAKRRFTIMGQVNRPGSYEMPDESPGGIDLLEAVALAGGLTQYAAPQRTSVRRQTSNGEEILRVDAKRMVKGGHGAFRVLPGDTITIGESIF